MPTARRTAAGPLTVELAATFVWDALYARSQPA